jgi:hypothetical protein
MRASLFAFRFIFPELKLGAIAIAPLGLIDFRLSV